ncbi:MAG: RNA polymerase sigma factor [Peptostreptococcaceae bacterium]
MINEDIKLIKKIKKKSSKSAANDLISKYYKEIYAYTYKQTLDKELSMDLTQEIFISVLKSINSYDENKSSFRTWIYKISTNKIVDYYRSKSYKYSNIVVNIEENIIEDKDDFIKNIENKEEIEKVLKLVNSMKVDLQEVFRLKIFSDYTFTQIATILKIPESTVKTKYYSIIKKIKSEFN